jgi:hypothetical protein
MCVSKSMYQSGTSPQAWPGLERVGIHRPARPRMATTTAFRFSVPRSNTNIIAIQTAAIKPGPSNPIVFQPKRQTSQQPADPCRPEDRRPEDHRRPEKVQRPRRILQLNQRQSTFATTTDTPIAVMISVRKQATPSFCRACELRIENKRMANFCQTAGTW